VVEMDCVEGESLCNYIRENRFIHIEEFYRFARQIIGAVAYSHVDVYKFLMDPVEDKLEIDPNDGRKYIVSPEKEQELIKKYGVVHNDLHSGNIIRRDYDGQYVLLDFGLAIQDSHCVKSSSRFDGAIEYCAPEKLDRGDISTQSDVYALGILLYEMLTGRVPFQYINSDGMTLESARNRVYMQHMNDTPTSIYDLRKQSFEATHPGVDYEQDYPDELEAVIMKCLEKNPTNRFKNAKSLLEAFECCRMPSESANPPSFPRHGQQNSEIDALMEEMRSLRHEVQTLRNSPSSNNIDDSPQVAIENPDTAHRNARSWLLSNLNWLWILVLCITCYLSSLCIWDGAYGASEVYGALAMVVGVACVIFLWLYKWNSKWLILGWITSCVTSIGYSREYLIPQEIVIGGVGLIGLCIAVMHNSHNRNK
ncbi:MAG: protein kinase, partial [Muribaculaceae bacterium]|nr:protein kinase [Muribaculaceae bacterium]